VIGRGTTSVVFFGENIFTKEKVAIKKIPKSSNNVYLKVKNEIELMKTCKHLFILEVIDEDEDEKYWRIILKLSPFGSLRSVICQFKNKAKHLPEIV
jgi:serine/threonine protein kinase